MPALRQTITLTPEENRMISLKYQSKRIGEMDLGELAIQVDRILLKVNIITGWVNPSGATLKVLQEQFAKKLLEDYQQLNPDEIEYAFRSAGTTIEDWGKTMNLNLIDKVLIPYTEKRYDLSRVEEVKKKPEQKVYSEEQLRNIWREDVENFFQRLRNGKKSSVPHYFNEILDHDELLHENETVDLFFVRRLNDGSENIYRRS